MEDRLYLRQNDIIKALSKKLADRDDTEKKFRLANFSTMNMFDLLKLLYSTDEDFFELQRQIIYELNSNSSLSEITQMVNRHFVHNAIVHPN